MSRKNGKINNTDIFVYAFAPEPVFGPPCFQLLDQIRHQEIQGFTSTHILNDTAQRLMSLEACATFNWPYAGIANRLKRHPEEIRKLKAFRQAIDQIFAIGIHILPVDSQNIRKAGDLSIQLGLLSGDALILPTMQNHGLTFLASNDSDFDSIQSIQRISPL